MAQHADRDPGFQHQVRALTARVSELRPDLPGLSDYAARTAVSPLWPA
ncbi:hypothetical protein AB0E62_31615 [Streptomyces sp. NPDC038707]